MEFSAYFWANSLNFINKPLSKYFDSFGLTVAQEVQKYLSTSEKQIIYSADEIQERDCVLCGYWCLYYLSEGQNGESILENS